MTGYFKYIEGSAKLAISYDTENKKPYRHEFISGEVDVEFGGEWYSDIIRIEYEPKHVKSGELSIEYDFDGW